MDFKSYFKDKKITLMGLGLLGRGVGDAKFLAEQGAILTITDLKTEEQLKESLEKLKVYDTCLPDRQVSYTLGEHNLKDFQPENCDLVIKSAGVPLNSPFIEEAKKNNIPVKMSTSLFAEFYPGTIVGITGTRGKSTVTAMIYEVLKNSSSKVFLGGNVRGISTLAHLPESSEDEIAVLELDSWQLQGFGDAKISPHISVFTTFYPDHLNYYNSDMDLYLDDKANIFKYQSKDDFLILGEQCRGLIQSKYPDIKSEVVVPNLYDISYKLKIPGEHNLYNASCAREATKALGIDDETIKETLENFKGVEGRLEFIKDLNGVKIYNDTTATTPEATIAAIKALYNKNSNTILIMGGSDKSLDHTELCKLLPSFTKTVVLLPGTGTEKLISNYNFPFLKSSNLKEALDIALTEAKEGDKILFSPAFASFGPPPGGFKNEYDRGEKFNEEVWKIK